MNPDLTPEPTPRTDAACSLIRGPNPWSDDVYPAVPVDFAKKLERELAVARRDNPDAYLASISDFVNTLARETGSKESPDYCMSCIKDAIDGVVFKERENRIKAEFLVAALKKGLEEERADNQRLKGYLAGTPSSHVEAVFQLAEELGFGASSRPPVDFIRQVLTEERERSEKLREALELASIQLTEVRRFLPSHGSFGEEGINAFEHAQSAIRSSLSTPGATLN